VPADLKLAEVDPRPNGEPSWLGIAERPRRIADATLDAIRTLESMGTGAAGGIAH
jgi:hypothetical protein